MSLDRLFEAARQARGRAYAPYSGFRVGAAVLGADGAVFAGCNVENAAYPVGLCAEAGAIAAMVAAGERRLAEVLVLGDGGALTTPCGACRQRIREFATGATRDPRRRAGRRAPHVHARRAAPVRVRAGQSRAYKAGPCHGLRRRRAAARLPKRSGREGRGPPFDNPGP